MNIDLSTLKKDDTVIHRNGGRSVIYKVECPCRQACKITFSKDEISQHTCTWYKTGHYSDDC